VSDVSDVSHGNYFLSFGGLSSLFL
jgi:hypothetical protein